MIYCKPASKNYCQNYDKIFGRIKALDYSYNSEEDMQVAPKDFIKNYADILPDFIKNSPYLMTAEYVEKPFSKIGLKNCSQKIDQNIDIVFTSDGNNGFYDLATMSERGIKSCQGWEVQGHRDKLVGSLLDPYVGIVYIADKTPHPRITKGATMLKRALVRYVYKHNGGNSYSKSLFVERVYSNNPGPLMTPNGYYNNQDSELSNTRKTFLTFLKQKTNSKIEIVYGTDLSYGEKIKYGRLKYRNLFNDYGPLNNDPNLNGCVDSAIPMSRYNPRYDVLI
jgi:hypothetical protein